MGYAPRRSAPEHQTATEHSAGSYLEAFRGSNLKRTLAVIWLFVGAGLAYAPGQGPLWAIAILMNILISWQIVTMTSVGWVITAEVSSYRLRGKTQSIAVISSAFATGFFTFTVP
ncbi:hypothetical protein PFICI_04927 [Pestalotiopsis fici W106-1]|uniref:Major facilitator superfamily (MFS) profile domain-containing protein n=1 Tax=Pestalotiopsis fici (strain W106-1 / CGMCC3.15140) TaxID=1229662 RepID=W3XCZ1_PESFW|nr:uncharacterized protein PFICI_04927 [Pestalotiopsis fici W106-1]ETS83051.1 hypothetical protein PFICI_04927 [Pestalotiopsis fici W106-1]